MNEIERRMQQMEQKKQQEEMVKWWRKWGLYLLAGGCVFGGLRIYQEYEESRAEARKRAIENALVAMRDDMQSIEAQEAGIFSDGEGATSSEYSNSEEYVAESPQSNNNKPLSFQLDMVWVEGGSFMMGSEEGGNDEKPVHKVTLSSYYISKYEITQAQYVEVMGLNPEKYAASNYRSRRKPEEIPMVANWEEATAFCKRLSAKTGKKYALPTEAQWEYAARGGNKSKGYKYSGSDNLDEVAWYKENSKDPDPYSPRSQTPGTKAPNELGIYDMSGNLSEWCADRYFSEYYNEYYSGENSKDPVGPPYGEHRVVRGGSYDDFDHGCHRVCYRDRYMPGLIPSYNYGFRVVMIP